MELSPKRSRDKIKISVDWSDGLAQGDTLNGTPVVTATNEIAVSGLVTSNNVSTFFVDGGNPSEATRLTGCIEGEVETANGERLTFCKSLIILPDCGTGVTPC